MRGLGTAHTRDSVGEPGGREKTKLFSPRSRQQGSPGWLAVRSMDASTDSWRLSLAGHKVRILGGRADRIATGEMRMPTGGCMFIRSRNHHVVSLSLHDISRLHSIPFFLTRAGFGKAIVDLFVAQGAKVVVMDLNVAKDAPLEVAGHGSGSAMQLKANVCQMDDWKRAVRTAVCHYNVAPLTFCVLTEKSFLLTRLTTDRSWPQGIWRRAISE